MESNHRSPASRQGFSLTELLVVILILAVLATLIMMGMSRIREMADKATSIRNLAQLQLANAAYATEHNGNCVPIRVNDSNGKTTRWFQDKEYLAMLTGRSSDDLENNTTLAISPDMLDPKVVRARKPQSDRVFTSYGMNDTGLKLGGEPDLNSGHNLNQAADPSRTMAFATATDFRINYNSRFKWNFENPNDSKTANGEIAYRHGDKVLVVYFDGHVGEVSKADFEKIDQAGGRNHAFWKVK
jgi:prepilin-type N-terminal cleavage/methylation domain-containing protein